MINRDSWARLEEEFHRLAELPAEERAAFVKRASSDDATTLGELRALLAAHDRPTATDAIGPLGLGACLASVRAQAGDIGVLASGARIGAYTVVRQIGSGGMGVVYEARQDHPRRSVALKVLPTTALGERARARFEYEADALGRLRHPSIAQIYESGVHTDPSGGLSHAYIAMELVDGAKPITDFAESASMSVRERLALMAEVCVAVAYGHRNGVIHRDLKPSNILIDDEGRVKIIDFGVAKLSASPDLPPHATIGGLAGTPEYMAPERFAIDGGVSDARCDVYSLGVVLHELLVGSRPHEVGGLPLVGAGRSAVPCPAARIGRRDPRLRGDIEVVVATALAGEPEARYAGADAFGDDLRRVVSGEPVRARRPSLAREVWWLGRRHKAAAATAASVLLGMSVAMGGVYVGLIRAMDARSDSDHQALVASQTRDLMTSIITNTNPRVDGPVSGIEMLDRAAARLDTEDGHLPEVELDVRRALANAYKTAGEYKKAEWQFHHALGLHRRLHPDLASEVACGASELAKMRRLLYDHEGAYRAVAGVCERFELSAETICAYVQLAQAHAALGNAAEFGALADRIEAFADRAVGADPAALGSTFIGLAKAARTACDFEASIAMLESAARQYERAAGNAARQELASTLGMLAETYSSRNEPGDLARADALFARAGGIHTELGTTGFDPIWLDRQRGNLALRRDDAGAAFVIYEDVVRRVTQLLGPDDLETGVSRLALARAHRALGDPSWHGEAEEAIAIIAMRLGDEHARVTQARREFGVPDRGDCAGTVVVAE